MREVDGDDLGSAQFGDTTSLISADSGDLELEFIRTDSDDQEILLEEMTVNYAILTQEVNVLRQKAIESEDS